MRSKAVLCLALASLVLFWPLPWAEDSAGTSGASLPLEPAPVWAAEQLPEGVPYWPSPYDEETQPPPVEGPGGFSPLNPFEILRFAQNDRWDAQNDNGGVQELVQRVAAIAVPAAAPPQAARPWSAISTEQIIANARALLGVRYLWGGNTTAGMDCSAFVSRAWGVSRHTTDSLHTVGYAISKDELRAGDVLNLTRRQDPRGFGHVRLFERWANPQKTRMWVYEETPPRAVYHAIAYDPRYTPMRRTYYHPEETVEELVAGWAVPDESERAPVPLVHRSLVTPPPTVNRASPAPPLARAGAAPRRQAEPDNGEAPAVREPAARPSRAGATRTPAPARPARAPVQAAATPTPARQVGLVQTAPPTPTPTEAPIEVPPPPTPTATPAAPPPPAPIRFSGLAQSCRRVLVSWDYEARNAAGFRIYRDGQFIGGISAETRYYVDASLRPETAYSYTVTAWNAGGESPHAKAVEIRTKAISATCK